MRAACVRMVAVDPAAAFNLVADSTTVIMCVCACVCVLCAHMALSTRGDYLYHNAVTSHVGGHVLTYVHAIL